MVHSAYSDTVHTSCVRSGLA